MMVTNMNTKISNELPVVNIAGYKFVNISSDRLINYREQLKQTAIDLHLKGTILLSREGININLSGNRQEIDKYLKFIDQFPEFAHIDYKESFSDHQPYTRMLVRLRKEIISMGRDEIQPEQETAPHLSAKEFHQWYREGRDMIVLDVRNDYEIALGAFENAVDLNIENFRAFPDAIDELPETYKEKPIVTYCTGGIRCEKAAAWLQKKGFKSVYQLNGGILNYFNKIGGDFFHGECFVFDKRVAVDSHLRETTTRQCYACRSPITPAQETNDRGCPFCHDLGKKRSTVCLQDVNL